MLIGCKDHLGGPRSGSGAFRHSHRVRKLKSQPYPNVENPQTYGAMYKWVITMIVAIATLAVALASSIYSGAIRSIQQEFHPSTEVGILGVSLFVVGFAAGPLIWAPLSEMTGRRNILIVRSSHAGLSATTANSIITCIQYTYIIFTLWNSVACASQNMASLIVFRFLAGLFGSSPLTSRSMSSRKAYNRANALSFRRWRDYLR